MKHKMPIIFLTAFVLIVFLASCNGDIAMRTVPGAPRELTALAGDGSVMLTWNAPLNDGGAAIGRYEVTYTQIEELPHGQAEEWRSVETLAYTYTGLTNGAAHLFKVRAVNPMGNGAEAVITATPVANALTVPGSPHNLEASSEGQSVTLTWQTPLNDGGSPILNYLVAMNGASPVSVEASPYVFTDLAFDTEYVFTVCAVNSVGTGGEASVELTLESVKPSAPRQLVTEVIGSGSIRLTWVAPEESGSGAVTYYQVSSDGAIWLDVLGLSHDFIGLVNGAQYNLRVRAVNVYGVGAASGVAVTPINPLPSVVINLVANATDSGVIVLTWAPPTANGYEVTGYEVQVGNGSRISTNNLTYALSGLENGTEYVFRVRAVNVFGAGEDAEINATPINPVPSKPRKLTASPLDKRVELSWETPYSSVGANIQYYEVTKNNWSSFTTAVFLSYSFTGLSNGTEYVFKVRAVNSYGYGEEATVSATPVYVPNELVCGVADPITGDWNFGWMSNQTDKAVYEMLNGYSLAVSDRDGMFCLDTDVTIKSYSRYEIYAEYQQSIAETIQYTFELYEGPCYSDGTPINAYDYAFAIMYFSEYQLIGTSFYGYEEFRTATSPTPFTGITILDDYKFSIVFDPAFLPYYYELSFLAISPEPIHMWLKDCGVTILTDENGHPMFNSAFYAAENRSQIEAARDYVRFQANGNGDFVSAGPYRVVNHNKSAQVVTLEINPYYLGDFRGHTPSIQTIKIVYNSPIIICASLLNGEIDFYDMSNTSAPDIATSKELVDERPDEFGYSTYFRNGHGQLMFICDYGPTQFVSVRKAIAHLVNRVEVVNKVTLGLGTLVHGPYGLGMWMYQENKQRLQNNLNDYSYSVDTAASILNDDGWIYNSDGDLWTSGTRYKDITDVKLPGPWLEDDYGELILDENGDRIPTEVPVSLTGYESRVKHVAINGKPGTRTIMPLIMDYIGQENSVTDAVKAELIDNPVVANIGMKITFYTVSFETMVDIIFRQHGFEEPQACMMNLATHYTAVYDMSYTWTGESFWIGMGGNLHRLYDLGEGGLDDLSMRMVYDIDVTCQIDFSDCWTDYVLRWNELLPELPLYSNVYYSFYIAGLKGYNPTALWGLGRAIIDAYIV